MIAQIIIFGSLFVTGYQLMQCVKYTVGLALLLLGKYEAFLWWHNNVVDQ